MLRRDFLKSMLIGGACAPLLTPQQLFAQTSSDNSNTTVPTVLWARRGKEEFQVDYSTDEGYKKIAWLLRDVQGGNIVGYPDYRLLQLDSWMQAWLAAYGYHVCFNIHSGLRTPKTNKRIERAAQASWHLPDDRMMFRANDFSVKEISSEYMGRLAALAQQGGVGFYSNDNFTHADTGDLISKKTGNPRYWRG
jgi:uncharacterized protein YcbK (DUF882 family)